MQKTFKQKTTSSILAFLVVFQTVAGIFLPVEISLAPPYVSVREARAVGDGWYDSNWQYRKAITIDHTKIDSDLTNFPVSVKLTSSNFNFTKANADGYDIRFTDSDGETLLKYEREKHNSVGETAEYWVKIPSVSSSATTTFYMYYRTEDTADGADPTNVWDTNAKMVQHLQENGNGTAGEYVDSTSNNNDGQGGGGDAAKTPSQVEGQIAQAQDFDGTDDWVGLPEPPAASTNINTGSVFAWIKTSDAGTSWRGIVVKQHAYGMFLLDNVFAIYDWGNGAPRSTGVNLADGGWHFVGFTFENIDASPSDNAKLYIDGEYQITTTLKLSGQDEGVVIGAGNNPASLQYFNGTIDEVRIYNRALSAAWTKADYNSGNDSLLSYGSEETERYSVMASTNYTIQSDSINFGGERGVSASYVIEDTLGEIATGVSTSSSYSLHAGYQQMYETYISMTSPTDVTLTPAIGGVTGGTANGSTAVTVTTDSVAGYELSIKASSSPAFSSALDDFTDYTTASAGVPDYTFTIAATSSEFGFSPEGDDIYSKYKDNGSACNTGSGDVSDKCWGGLSTTNELIAKSTTANHPDGVQTTIKFRAQSGSSHIQVAGDYVATTTITAIAL